MNNIRYITNTTIGTWAIDKLGRFCLLPQDDDPINWDFGSAAKHHTLYAPWLGEGRSRAGISTLRGAMPPGAHRAEDVARKIRIELEERGLHKEPVGVDVVELPVLFALQKEGLTDRRWSAVDAGRARDQDAGRDHAAQHGVHDGRCRLRGTLSLYEARRARKRMRRAGQQCAVLPRLGARRGRQRDLRRALQPAPAHLQRPRAASRRPRLLRHSAQLHGLPHLLLPHLRGRQRFASAGRCLQALPLLPRRGDQHDQAGRDNRRCGQAVAQS